MGQGIASSSSAVIDEALTPRTIHEGPFEALTPKTLYDGPFEALTPKTRDKEPRILPIPKRQRVAPAQEGQHATMKADESPSKTAKNMLKVNMKNLSAKKVDAENKL